MGGLDGIYPLLIPADVEAHIHLDDTRHARARHIVAVAKGHSVAFGAEPGQEIRFVGGQLCQVPGRQLVTQRLRQA